MSRSPSLIEPPASKKDSTPAAVDHADGDQNPAATDKWRRFRKIVAGILIVGAAIWVWDELIKYRVIAKRWGEVVPGQIYRSGQISQWMVKKSLKNHDIQVVIDLTGAYPGWVDQPDQQAEKKAIEKLDIAHYRYPLGGDGTGDIRMYAEAIATLARCERDGKPVLIHCAAGAQRAGGVVATYRMLVRKESPQVAYSEMRRYGWKPEKSQILVDYVNENMPELARLLVARGVLAEIPNPLPVLGP